MKSYLSLSVELVWGFRFLSRLSGFRVLRLDSKELTQLRAIEELRVFGLGDWGFWRARAK